MCDFNDIYSIIKGEEGYGYIDRNGDVNLDGNGMSFKMGETVKQTCDIIFSTAVNNLMMQQGGFIEAAIYHNAPEFKYILEVVHNG